VPSTDGHAQLLMLLEEIEDIAACLAELFSKGLLLGFEAGAISQFLFFGLLGEGHLQSLG
jgi:hypothetical protein